MEPTPGAFGDGDATGKAIARWRQDRITDLEYGQAYAAAITIARTASRAAASSRSIQPAVAVAYCGRPLGR
jgi:hypothetical protein